jgi:hypothetical protein
MKYPQLVWVLAITLVYVYITMPRFVSSDRLANQYKRDNEPKLVSWKVLEGVTEPFDSYKPVDMPAWKQMKVSADHKSSNLLIQQALHEYGQLIRHPHIFGEMPMEERYDVFLSMSKLLKQMGFHQRAELLLYEAMSYSTSPHEAHLQLALLLLDRENIDMAKVHLKNCLFFRESDVLVMIHLTVVLIAEGRINESKFFISRILSKLQTKYDRLSQILNNADPPPLPVESKVDDSMTSRGTPEPPQQFDLPEFYRWLEDLMARVFHGDLRLTAATTVEFYRMFSNLYEWITRGEMTGRFVFDLGQALYEGGRPFIGLAMMKRGLETSDAASEGIVSPEIVKMRLAIDFPVIPSSIFDIVDSYLNTTNFLSDSSKNYVMIDMENVYDIHWPLPLLGWSGLPTWPVVSELMWRFSEGKERSDEFSSQVWLSHSITPNISVSKMVFPIVNFTENKLAEQRDSATTGTHEEIDEDEANYVKEMSQRNIPADDHESGTAPLSVPFTSARQPESRSMLDSLKGIVNSVFSQVNKHTTASENTEGGSAAASRQTSSQDGKVVKQSAGSKQITREQHSQRSSGGHKPKPVAYNTIVELALFAGHMNSHPVGQMMLHRVVDVANAAAAMMAGGPAGPLFRLTLIALPLVPDDVTSQIASKVQRIVNLPMDTKSAWALLEKLRIDIMMFPDWQPFPDVQSSLFQWKRIAPVQVCIFVRGTSCASTAIDYYIMPKEIEQAFLASVPAADSTSTVIVKGRSGSRTAVTQQVRPPWRELFAEQIVFLQWPLLTTEVIKSVTEQVHRVGDEVNSKHASIGGNNDDHYTGDVPIWEQQIFRNTHSKIAPLSEQEGQIFFEGQPVAIIAAHPTHVHPLMDDTIFKLMHTIPTLQVSGARECYFPYNYKMFIIQVVLVLPEAFFSHATDVRQRTCWSRKLVRRLWDR